MNTQALSQASSCRTDAAQGASTQLLSRPLSTDYQAQQTQQIAAPPSTDTVEQITVMIFRLDSEWFALRAKVCQQVVKPVVAHKIPHRTNQTLQGVVNINGQMLLKVSLAAAMGLSADTGSKGLAKFSTAYSDCAQPYNRTVVIEQIRESNAANREQWHREAWVFEADELVGIYAISKHTLELPTSGAKLSACTVHLFSWKNVRVSFLDDVRLFELLRQKAL